MADVIKFVSKSNTYAKACANIDNNHDYAEVQPQARSGKNIGVQISLLKKL
ncbi:MAG: hypothetical protein PHI16_00555 [Methanocellales archaeon]|nr:hypothetical protein [Methanocellales archaeon]